MSLNRRMTNKECRMSKSTLHHSAVSYSIFDIRCFQPIIIKQNKMLSINVRKAETAGEAFR